MRATQASSYHAGRFRRGAVAATMPRPAMNVGPARQRVQAHGGLLLTLSGLKSRASMICQRRIKDASAGRSKDASGEVAERAGAFSVGRAQAWLVSAD